jgi:HAD superfamily hydrolase (TIGR01450 family)
MRNKIELVVFDLDGTIYNGSQIINGAIKAINFFKTKNTKVIFFTNNSAQTRAQIFKKLQNFSIDLLETEVYCCSYATEFFLRTNNIKNIHMVGSDAVKKELKEKGINVISENNSENIEALLIGMDLNFNYWELSKAYEILQKNPNSKVIVCNMDYNFPFENGLKRPGCGAIASSILSTSERKIDFMIGKPSSFMLDIISKENNVLNEKVLVIGDSYESDIIMANNSNACSILIDNSGSKKIIDTLCVSNIKEVPHVFNKYYS